MKKHYLLLQSLVILFSLYDASRVVSQTPLEPPLPQGSFYQKGRIISQIGLGIVGCTNLQVPAADGSGCFTPGGSIPSGTLGQPAIYDSTNSIASSAIFYDASKFTGADWGAKVTACLAAATGHICDATALNGTQSSSTSITIPANTTLIFDGTVTLANSNNLTVNSSSYFIGKSQSTSIFLGNTSGDLIHVEGGSAFVDKFYAGNSDVTDATSTTIDFYHASNSTIGDIRADSGYTSFAIKGSYYIAGHSVKSLGNYGTPNTCFYIDEANSSQISFMDCSIAGPYGFIFDNTESFTIGHVNIENVTNTAIFGGLDPVETGPINVSIGGGYIQPVNGAYIFDFTHPNVTALNFTLNGVLYFGANLGCKEFCDGLISVNDAGTIPPGGHLLSIHSNTGFGNDGPKLVVSGGIIINDELATKNMVTEWSGGSAEWFTSGTDFALRPWYIFESPRFGGPVTGDMGFFAGGTTFTVSSGCGTTGTVIGGSTAGSFTSGQNACAPVINTGLTATNGWVCNAVDVTHGIPLIQTASTTAGCTVSGTVTSGDTILVSMMGY
jgi:hypothetical protein